MKHARSLAIVLAALTAPLFPQNARAEADVSFEYFDEVLSPFGEWIKVADYGLCWRPTGVAEDWAPYTDGYWAYTDAGWTWVSYEDWGGITYHYGRWIHLVDEGWVWVPDYQWGPAWVSWRSSEEYVGWAPLPPEARWEESTGFSTWVDTSYDIGPESYRFCHTRDFGAPVLAPVCLPYAQNVTFIVSTVNVTNITYNHHSSVVFCGGPSFFKINESCHRPIPSLKLRCEDREVLGPHGNRQPQIVRGNALAVYAPKMKRPVDSQALPVKPQRVVGAEKINRGWSRGTDLAAQQRIKERLQKQTAGLTPRTAPARPVQAADLRSVPVKVTPNAPSPNAIVRNPARPPASPAQVAPPQSVAGPELPRPGANPPKVGERVRPANTPPPVQPQPFPNPPARISERPQPPRAPQVAVPDESARSAEVERARVQREQQQQDAAPRANELRDRQARSQNEQREQRVAEERRQQMQQQPQRQQNDAAASQQAEARRQQALQQRQEIVARQQQENANRAAAIRQQQEAAQRSGELRQRQAEQQQSAQRANEMRAQQAAAREQQQAAAQRTNEMRQQQAQHAEIAKQRQEAVQRMQESRQQPPPQQATRQAEPPQRQQAAPAPQPQSRPAPARGDDDDKPKQRSR